MLSANDFRKIRRKVNMSDQTQEKQPKINQSDWLKTDQTKLAHSGSKCGNTVSRPVVAHPDSNLGTVLPRKVAAQKMNYTTDLPRATQTRVNAKKCTGFLIIGNFFAWEQKPETGKLISLKSSIVRFVMHALK